MSDADFPAWADDFGTADTLGDSSPSAQPAVGNPGVPGYELLHELGRGGTAVVYLARQVALDRRVALKMVLAGGFASAADRQRFRAEAAAVAAVQHPGIVQVYEVGACGDRPYFALEYCPGGSLAQRLTGGPLPPRDAAALIEQVARAVHAAHDRGIVHRDLKPGNILFAEDGTPKITDFGLARRADTDTALTRTGAVLGTPSYMAPEQARGRRDVGPAADVYALGAVLYECLTGRPPFLAATGLDTVLHAIHDDPVPPSRLTPKVPRDLETIALKCLQKDPAKRYPGAEALADDLARFLAGEPIKARPVPGWERAWKLAKRRPAAAVGLAASALSVGLVIGVVLVANARLQRERDDADLARRDAEARRLEAVAAQEEADRQRRLAHARLEKAVEAVERMMTRVADERWAAKPELQEERRQVLEDAVAFFNSFVGEDSKDPIVRREASAAYMRAAGAYMALGKYPGCQRAAQAALDLRRGLSAEFPFDPGPLRGTAESLGLLARVAELFGRYDEARRDYEDAVRQAERAVALNRSADESRLVLAEAYTAYAQSLDGQDPERALEYQTRALQTAKELAARPGAKFRVRLALATALVNLGVRDTSRGLKDGFRYLEEARPLVEQLDAESAPTARTQEQFALTRAALHMFRGSYLATTGRKKEGVKVAEAGMDGLDAMLKLHGKSFPLRAQKLHFLLMYAEMLYQAGYKTMSRVEFDKATTLRNELLKDFPDLTWLVKIGLVQQSYFLVIKGRDGEPDGLDRAAAGLLKEADRDVFTANLVRYNWACAHAQLAHTGPEGDRDRHAVRAVKILNDLIDAGYFCYSPGVVDHVEADPDLDPLRPRPDFKKFLARVKSLPKYPFAQTTQAD